MATPSQGSEPDIPTELTEAVRRGQWIEVLRLVHTEDCSPQQRHWAIENIMKRAKGRFLNDRLDEICDIYADNDSLVSHLLTRHLWRCVGRVIQRDISHTQHRQAVEEASRHTNDICFSTHILPRCYDEELDSVLTCLESRGMWRSVGEVLERGVSSPQHRWAVEHASRHADEQTFAHFILPHCTDKELKQVFSHMVLRGMWWSVGKVLERGVSSPQLRWAVEHASRHADEQTFVHFILPHCTGEELKQVFSHMVLRGMWWSVGKVLERGMSSPQHRWAVEQASRHADEGTFVHFIIPHCTDKELKQVFSHMVSRGLWMSVVKVLERGVSSTQHRWAVEQASRQCDDDVFVEYILSHCYDEELDSVLTHLVLRGLWKTVSKVLERGVSSTQHRWAVEEASRHADEKTFVHFILHHCTDEELEQVFTHMVSRGLWKPVDNVTDMAQYILSWLMALDDWAPVCRFLQRNISGEVHRWAVEQAIKQCDDDVFVDCILPHCYDEELDSVLTHLVSQGLWVSVHKVLERGVSSTQHRWAVEQASRHADEGTFVHFILHHCTDEDLEQVFSHMVSRGLWKPLDNVTDMAKYILSRLMSQKQWNAVGRFLQQNISDAINRWAVEQASRHADEKIFAEFILPQCRDKEPMVAQMMSQDQWAAVGVFLQQNISVAIHRWTVEQASRLCNDDVFVNDILPQCHDEEMGSVLAQLAFRGLWSTVDKVLERGVSSTQLRLAFEEASRYFSDIDFCCNILHRCYDEELECVLPHLVLRGMWKSVDCVLKRCINTPLHRLSLVEAVGHVGDSNYHVYLLRHCSEDDVVVAVFPHLVASKRWTCVQHVLWTMAHDTLHTWMTSEHCSKSRDTLFWKVIHNCQVDGSLAFSLTKAATQKRTDSGLNVCWGHCYNVCSHLAGAVSWRRSLCEVFITTLLYTLCDLMCNDDSQYTKSTKKIALCVSEIYTHITACIKDNTHCVKDNTLKTIQNKEKWTSVFTELADSHSNDPMFLLHFMQGLNLYHTSRRGEKDDFIVQVTLAVFPLFPQLQSVALRIMLREKRWDVLSQACLSHVWEHDRRRLFKAAVMQRQWDVVRQWCDHTVHDDQRHWALTEAFKEKQWDVYLLLVDHGLTVDEQMYAHYRVAKYGHWATVLKMVDRGGDITEVSNLLDMWVMRYLRKKPEGDVTVYEQRCMKLIRLRLRFARKSVLSSRKALERCLWGTVLFNILHKPTKRFFSEVLEKVIEEQQWHVLMHLVRLGMTSADRDRLFPDMVRQQQWGVCRQLLEHGVDVQLCLEALSELMEKNQWMLVARVMEHDVDDAVRRQVLLWAFQRRAGALFWHCLNLMEEQEDLSTAVKEQLFHQAISHEIWQAVKPLVKEKAVRHLMKGKDGPDIQRRDLTFLEAIEQHLWDVVDYCQRLGADINMKDENGETPLNREARKREWKAAEEIVLHDGDPNHLDMDGVSVMNRLIHHGQWDIVKLVIKYGGDIHLSARLSEELFYIGKTHTPLQALITARQADVIHFTIKWCGGQDWGVNENGERVLHAVCDSDRWDVMRDLIDIKVNPLVLTNTGKSPLVYAVMNTKCGQRMVAECSRQGFSFHQPSLTGPQESLLQDVSQAVVGFSTCLCESTLCDNIRWKSEITSPLVCAVLCELPVVAFMLYESGSCSNTELFTLHTQLPKLTDLNTDEGRALQEQVNREIESMVADDEDQRESYDSDDSIDNDTYVESYMTVRYSQVIHILKRYTPFLRELATTPLPLLSTCRLKILQSPCFHFGHKHREKAMGYDYLRLPESLKEYLKFSDLCDPDYGGHMK